MQAHTIALPIIHNPNAQKHGFATKLIPCFIDGVQTAWEQVIIHSPLTEVRKSSPAALRAAGFRVPFDDYDPIVNDSAKREAQAVFKPAWAGD